MMDEETMFEKYYTVSEIDGLIREQQSDFEFSLADVILLVLYADKEPIKGKTRQMKQIFLALKEVLPVKKIQPTIFKPRQFGPYSKEVEHTIDHLAFSNYIKIHGKKASNNFSIQIEPKGAEYIKEKFNRLGSKTQNTLIEKRHEWDAFTSTGIINYVYIHNKEYLVNSVLKNRHKLDWKDDKQKHVTKSKNGKKN